MRALLLASMICYFVSIGDALVLTHVRSKIKNLSLHCGSLEKVRHNSIFGYGYLRRLNIFGKYVNPHGDLIRRFRFASLSSFVACALLVKKVSATVVSSVTEQPLPRASFPTRSALLWVILFLLSATLHSAESAIMKISPWKVQEFADEEGPESPFAALSSNLTRLLSTILITTTACSIYSTALFVATACAIFPSASLGSVTAVLTAMTLFFGELLPKALAVSNSELVARRLVPPISQLATILLPFSASVTFCSDLLLRIAGLKTYSEDKNVSEDMLRLVVSEAERSEQGIATDEGKMIKAVLDMQDKEVSRIMQPRIDIVAVPEEASAAEILTTALSMRYSRIPVYREDIDHIVGVVFSKDLLTFVNPSSGSTNATVQKESWANLTAAHLMQPTYFIPETMTAWTALQEMRKRRNHMAIVVDEYGGTAGLVTFEDILEEVVGEIYDEDDDEEQATDFQSIFRESVPFDGGTSSAEVTVFTLRGYAELDDVCDALGIDLDDLDDLGPPSGVGKSKTSGGGRGQEYSTIGGLVCSRIGAIPREGDQVVFAGYEFTVVEVEDNRRVATLTAKRISVSKNVPQLSSVEEDAPIAISAADSEDMNLNNSSAYSGEILTFVDGEWVEAEKGKV